MRPLQGDDLAAFQAKVLREIERLQKLSEAGERFYKEPPFPKSNDSERAAAGYLQWAALSLLKKFMRYLSAKTYEDLKAKRETLIAQAEALSARPEIKQSLCPKFIGVKNDPFEIARITTPLLAELAADDAASMNLKVSVFAIFAIIIAGKGVDKYCSPEKI